MTKMRVGYCMLLPLVMAENKPGQPTGLVGCRSSTSRRHSRFTLAHAKILRAPEPGGPQPAAACHSQLMWLRAHQPAGVQPPRPVAPSHHRSGVRCVHGKVSACSPVSGRLGDHGRHAKGYRGRQNLTQLCALLCTQAWAVAVHTPLLGTVVAFVSHTLARGGQLQPAPGTPPHT